MGLQIVVSSFSIAQRVVGDSARDTASGLRLTPLSLKSELRCCWLNCLMPTEYYRRVRTNGHYCNATTGSTSLFSMRVLPARLTCFLALLLLFRHHFLNCFLLRLNFTIIFTLSIVLKRIFPIFQYEAKINEDIVFSRKANVFMFVDRL